MDFYDVEDVIRWLRENCDATQIIDTRKRYTMDNLIGALDKLEERIINRSHDY